MRILDEPLPDAESGAHLEACAECRERLNDFAEASRAYNRFHTSVLKPSLSPAPRQWEPLRFPTGRRASIRPARWLWAAAAIAALAVAVRLFEPPASVRAAMLLRKAAAAERAAPQSGRRIRIRTNSRVLDRDARVHNGPEAVGAAALRILFDSAGYPWDNPLSAQAFTDWRASMADVRDEIEESGGIYTLRTFVGRGPLSGADLTLRAADLHALSCTLRFRSGGEIIYMTELPTITPPAPIESTPAPAPGQNQRLVLRPAVPPTASDELHVLAALHVIGADLGEPIEIERNNAVITVRVSGLDENRRAQIRKALSGLITVMLQFEPAGPADTKPAAPGKPAGSDDRPNQFARELANRLNGSVTVSDLRDQLIDATDRAAQRAFALRALARRFPPAEITNLSAGDSALLGDILRDHAEALSAATQEIRRTIAPILPNPAAAAGTDSPDWQTAAERLPALVDRLDRTLNGAGDSSEARKAQLAQCVADLERQIALLQTGRPQ